MEVESSSAENRWRAYWRRRVKEARAYGWEVTRSGECRPIRGVWAAHPKPTTPSRDPGHRYDRDDDLPARLLEVRVARLDAWLAQPRLTDVGRERLTREREYVQWLIGRRPDAAG